MNCEVDGNDGEVETIEDDDLVAERAMEDDDDEEAYVQQQGEQDVVAHAPFALALRP